MTVRRSGGSGIGASLGSLQHMRSAPPAAAPPSTGYPDTRANPQPNTRLDTRMAASPRGGGKRSDPRYAQLKAYVLKDSKRLAMRKAADQGHEDFSDLVQMLLDAYLGS